MTPAAGQQPRAAANTFRTAGQQLAIDRAKAGKNDGITQSSYGSGKRNFGTRPGPAGGFKPPVRNMGELWTEDREQQRRLGWGRRGGGGGPQVQEHRHEDGRVNQKLCYMVWITISN